MATVLQHDNTTRLRSRPATGNVEADGFTTALSWLLPEPIAYRGGRIETLQEPLHGSEAPFVRNAVERRVREFTAGRTCARSALKQLGLPDVPVRVGHRREPLWPEGVTGSISHAAGFCVAAACTRDHLASLGVDIESAGPLSDPLIDLVCLPAEKAWCGRQPQRLTGLLAKFMFSAKEAVFKCLFPVFGEELDFEDVSLELDMQGGYFVARVSRLALNIDGDLELHGRLACSASLVMTSAMLRASDLGHLQLDGTQADEYCASADSFPGPAVPSPSGH